MTTHLKIGVGAQGLWSIAAPWAVLMPPQTVFTCRGVRKLGEIIAGGEDPYEKYYIPNTIAESEFIADRTADASILSLSSDFGQWIYIPSTCVQAYPDTNGVTYRAMMLGISIGPVPDTTSLDALMVLLGNVVKDTLGVAPPTVKAIAVSEPTVIPYSEHALIETARTALKIINKSDRSKLASAQATITTLTDQLTILQNYVKANMPPAPTPSPTPAG